MSVWPESQGSPVGTCRRCSHHVVLRLLADGLCPPCWQREREARLAWAALRDVATSAVLWLLGAGAVVAVVVVVVAWLRGAL